MSDNKPIVIGRIPAHARLPNGYQMRKGMLMLDRFADTAAGRTPDGKFTKANFEYYRKKSDAFLRKHAPHGIGLKKFKSFAAFKKFLRARMDKSPGKPRAQTNKTNLQFERMIKQLIKVARTSKDMRKRWEAVDTLGANFFWHPQVLKFAVEILKLTPAQARKHAISIYGGARVRIALLFKPSLLTRGMARLKVGTLKAVGLGGGAKEVSSIAPLLKSKNDDVRRAAIKALRMIYARHRTPQKGQQIKDPAPAPIISILLKDRSTSARMDAVRVLGMMRNTATESTRLSAIIAALNDHKVSVAKLAMEALATVGKSWTIRYITPFLKDRRSGVRAEAARCIGRFKRSSPQIRVHTASKLSSR